MAKSKNNGGATPPGDGYEYIFVAYITLRNGKRLYAWQKGLKAFRIRVKKGGRQKGS